MLAQFKNFAFPTEDAYINETIRWTRNHPAVKCLGNHQWVVPAALRCFHVAACGSLSAVFGILGCAQKKVNAVFPQIQYPAHRIAVLPFESGNPYVNGASLSDWMVVQIIKELPGVQVIERKDLMKILQEQKLTLTGIVRQSKFSNLGMILGVDAILTGSVETLEVIQSASGSILVTVKLMEVSTGRVLWADRMKISHSTWQPKEVEEISALLMEKAAQKMVERLGKSPALARLCPADPTETAKLLPDSKLDSASLR